MPNNPLTPQELLTFIQASAQQGQSTPQFPAKYVFATDSVNPGSLGLRLFDAAYISTGIIDPNRLGTGSTGAGNLYLADDGTWKTISVGGGGDMLKATYDVDNDGVVDSAERTEIIVRNSTGSTLTKGTVVYLSGATGNRPNALRAQAHTEATSSKTIGMVEADIPNNSDGYVATNGTLHNLDTSAFTAGDAVWLSATTAGGITTTVPAEPNHAVFVGYIVRAHPTQGRIVLHFQNGYELNELHGVLLTSEANNDLLVYESSTDLWKNKTFSAIFGGTPLVSVPTLAAVTTAGNTTSNTIIYSGTTEAIRPSVDSTGALGASNFRWLNVYTRGVSSGANSLDILGTNINLNDSSGNIKLRVFGSTGNVVIQNGGTFTDAGYRLDVAGTGRMQGSLDVVGLGTQASPSIVNIYGVNATTAGDAKLVLSQISGGNDLMLLVAGTDTRSDGLTSNDQYVMAGQRLNLMSRGNGSTYNTRIIIGDGSTSAYANIKFQTATQNSAPADRMLIDHLGNVGIGTITPNQKLTVSGIIEAGSASATAGAVTLYQTYSSPNYLGSMSTEWGSGAMILGYGAIGKSGVAGFVSTFANFTGLRAAIRLGQGTVSIFSSLTAVNTAVGSDLTMTETVRISESGNVGIGTNNPQTKIHLGTTNSSVRIDTSLSNSAFLTGWQDAVAIGVNRDPQNGNFTNTSKAAASIFLYGQSNSSFINFSTTTSNNTLPTERMRLESSGNLLINTTTDSGYKLNVNGTAYIGGVATLNSNANIAGSVATPQITARKYYQNPDGVPTNNLGDPTVTEMALFDEQFNNKTAFYNNTSLTFWTSSDGVNYTEYTGFSTTAKKRFLGGDTDSGVYIPNLTNRFRIELENTQGYVFLNALYLYWSSNSHSTQVHIWKQRCDNGVWYQHTNSTTLVSSWPGHLYLPFSSIAFLPLPSTSSSHFNRIRIEFIPTWSGDATWGSQHIYLNRMQIWGGYPAGKRNLFSTDEDRNVTYPANITTVGALTAASLSVSGSVVASGGNSSNWNTAYTNRITSLTTTGSSGAATLISNVLNIPNYTLAGLGYSVPTLAQVTTAGNTTTNVITVGGLTVATNLIYTDTVNGRVGIGTSTPGSALDITQTTSIVRINSSLVSSFHGIEFRNSTNLDAEIKQLPSSGEFRISNGRSVGWGGFTTFYTDTVERMRIRNNGNVLIGATADAGYKLDVNGTARVQGAFTATLANVSTANVVYYNSSTGLMTYATAPIGAQFVIDYDYNIVGLKNGSNVLFTTSATFIVNTTRVFLNGQRLTRGAGYDYIETGTNQITFTNPPVSTDLIIIEYQI